MRLASGARVGPYEITAPLGAGGMGEVYRARDSRLGREVAIKVLPAAFALEPEFQQRLQREAQAISSLSHPHICPLYDIGHDAGVDYLVMEYLDGETLAARLTRGPIPLDQVLRYGVEIAGALAAAHRAGLVHRDLKPGNVMLTRTGARLLDFGLAKPAAAEAGAAPDAATVSAPITARGTLVGTFQYMSPEQVQGGEADARSDIFALGAVLYEMITGTRAFDGKTTASVAAAVLERDPAPPSRVQPLTPSELDDIVRGCLAKDPDERWQTAHDVRLQLEALRRRGPAAAAVSVRRVGPAALVGGLLAAAAIVAAALVGTWYLDRTGSPPVPLVTASLLPPPAHAFTPNDFAISPDGKRLAFVAFGDDGVSTLWVSSIESGNPLEIAGSDGAASPFWSPDNRWVGFFAQSRLMKVEPGGVGLQTICSTSPLASGGTWSAGGRILFTNDVLGPLWGVPAAGGTPAPFTKVPQDLPGEAHRFPQFLPDGRVLYIASWTNAQRGGLYLGAADGQASALLSAEIQSRAVLAGDQLLYVNGGTLYAAPFDATAGTLTGAGVALLRNEVVSDWRFGDVPLSASANGILVYQSPGQTELILHDRGGKELGVVGRRGFGAPMLSGDGRRATVTYDAKSTGQAGVWIHDLHRNVSFELSSNGVNTGQAISRDGRWVAYAALRERYGIYRRLADGSGAEERLLDTPAHALVNGFNADATRLLWMDFASGGAVLKSLDIATGESAVIGPGAEGSYSPDGKWIGYLDPTVSALVIKRADGSGKVNVATGGSQLRWRGDSKELFYMAYDRKLMALPLTVTDDVLEPGTPRALFQTRIVQPRLVLFQYDVSSDGERVLINSLPRSAAPLKMVVNWPRAAR